MTSFPAPVANNPFLFRTINLLLNNIISYTAILILWAKISGETWFSSMNHSMNRRFNKKFSTETGSRPRWPTVTEPPLPRFSVCTDRCCVLLAEGRTRTIPPICFTHVEWSVYTIIYNSAPCLSITTMRKTSSHPARFLIPSIEGPHAGSCLCKWSFIPWPHCCARVFSLYIRRRARRTTASFSCSFPPHESAVMHVLHATDFCQTHSRNQFA